MAAVASVRLQGSGSTSFKAAKVSNCGDLSVPRQSFRGVALRKLSQSSSLILVGFGSGSVRRVRCVNNEKNSRSSKAWRWDHEDSKYLEAQVVEAVSLLPSQGHLFMTLANGGEVEIDYVNPPKGRLLYRSRNPTIFLKILCEAELLLPIIVGDVAVGMLMKALRGDESLVKEMRPNQYQLMRDLVDSLNFEVRMVRVTQRVADTYLARIFIGRPGEQEMQSVDARPSDAVNLAVRCKVPIYVNKDIVYSDSVKPVYASTQTAKPTRKYNHLSALDRPQNGRDPVAEEMNLLKNMLLAVVEERYTDAARWRDELKSLRARRRRVRLL